MPEDLDPQNVLEELEKGELSSIYLFHGPGEFRMEKVLMQVRERFIPESAADLNVQIFYGDKAAPGDILESARSMPFLSQNRLIIVRKTESFSAQALDTFLPYLEAPVESTCLIFLSAAADFKKKFYRKIRALGKAVHFGKLQEREVIPWIRRMARDLGLKIEDAACAYLQQIVGSALRDLNSELEKLSVRYGRTTIGIEEVKELATSSRSYTIFELIDEVSFKRCARSLQVLNRYLEEADRDGPLKIVGMLNRQIWLLWQTKSVIEGGGRTGDVVRKIRLPTFLAGRILQQSKHWTTNNLEEAIHLLYDADDLLKSGSRARAVLENLVVSLCDERTGQDALS